MQDIYQQKHQHCCIIYHSKACTCASSLPLRFMADHRQNRCAAHKAKQQRKHSQRCQALCQQQPCLRRGRDPGKHCPDHRGRLLYVVRPEDHKANQYHKQRVQMLQHCHHWVPPALAMLFDPKHFFTASSATIKKPCHRPQTINVQLAPCHRPVQKKTISLLR